MQGIFEIFSTFAATMTIVDTKDLQLWPWLRWYSWIFLWGLDHVKNNWDAVFVGLSNYSNISISCKCFDWSESLRADLALLKERQGALRLILLQKLTHSSLYTIRGHLSFSSCPFAASWSPDLFRKQIGSHYDTKSCPLANILYETCSGFRRL